MDDLWIGQAYLYVLLEQTCDGLNTVNDCRDDEVHGLPPSLSLLFLCVVHFWTAFLLSFVSCKTQYEQNRVYFYGKVIDRSLKNDSLQKTTTRHFNLDDWEYRDYRLLLVRLFYSIFDLICHLPINYVWKVFTDSCSCEVMKCRSV